jgi:hypothetical protein
MLKLDQNTLQQRSSSYTKNLNAPIDTSALN